MNFILNHQIILSEFNKARSVIERKSQLKKQRFVSRVLRSPGNVVGSSGGSCVSQYTYT